MAISIITNKFRIENAKRFVQSIKNRPYPAGSASFSTSQTDYERVKSAPYDGELDALYMLIGKITTWYDENNLPVNADTAETPVPEVTNYLRQESEVWSNAIVAKKVDITNIKHVIPRENWTLNTGYPYYKSDDSNTGTFSSASSPNFYVLDEKEFRVYKCLFDYYGSTSSQRPTNVGGIGGDPKRIGIEPFETQDGYVWKYMYTIDPADALNFVTQDYIPVQKDTVNDDGTSTDNSSKDGAVYRIWFPQKTGPADTVAATNDFVRVRVEAITPSTDLTNSGSTLQVNLGNTDNRARISSEVANDMVDYQVEQVIDDGVTKRVEIGRILSSSISANTLSLDIERVDDTSQTGFTDVDTLGATTSTWFISPFIDIAGEGKDASALLYVQGETGFDTTERKLYPEAPATSGAALDVLMNTTGEGYRNIHHRHDEDENLSSYVVIRQGAALLGAAVALGATTAISDREILDVAEIVSVTPYGGHSYDNISELYGYTIMFNHTFSGDEDGSASVQNDFRQIALVQNPLQQGDPLTLADAAIYRQSIRLEFDGDVTGTVGYDDEISDKENADDEKTVFGRVVETYYNNVDDKTFVYLSSSAGFFERTASEIYNLDTSHRLFLSYDYDAGTSTYDSLILSARFVTPNSDGEYQKGLGSGTGNAGLKFMSGDLLYVENRQPIVRVSDQSENIKLIVEY